MSGAKPAADLGPEREPCQWRDVPGKPRLVATCSVCGREWSRAWLHNVFPYECPIERKRRVRKEADDE